MRDGIYSEIFIAALLGIGEPASHEHDRDRQAAREPRAVRFVPGWWWAEGTGNTGGT